MGINTAKDRQGVYLELLGQFLGDLVYLLTKFAGWRQHQPNRSFRPLQFGLFEHVREQRNQVGESLARARLRDPEHVSALEGARNRLALDRCWLHNLLSFKLSGDSTVDNFVEQVVECEDWLRD